MFSLFMPSLCMSSLCVFLPCVSSLCVSSLCVSSLCVPGKLPHMAPHESQSEASESESWNWIRLLEQLGLLYGLARFLCGLARLWFSRSTLAVCELLSNLMPKKLDNQHWT